MEKMTFRTGSITLLVILGLVSGVFYGKNITSPPGGHHAWAMADYYAMAIKFADNHLNIFRPQTFSLDTKDGVTAADFPLPAWCSAVLMSISGSDSPAIFRLLTLCFGFTGFFFFYRSLFERGLSAAKAVLFTLFLWFLPGLVYYHDGFMPSIWALNAFLIGLWALQRDIQGKAGYWTMAIGAFVLAALLRKPYLLPLLALGAWHIYFRRDWRKTLIGLAGLSVFALWQLYDWHLHHTYGSIFLRNLMSPRSAAEAWQLIIAVWRKWGLIWFSPAHIAWLLLALAAMVKHRGTRQVHALGWYFGGVLLAGIVYFGLMLRQFSDHEYYAIDSFYPMVFVGLLLGAKTLQEHP